MPRPDLGFENLDGDDELRFREAKLILAKEALTPKMPGACNQLAARTVQALERLDSLGAVWNREQGVPEAPASRDDLKGQVADWKAWYRAMLAFPLESEATKTES